ncbi:MAG: OmpA family protein [Myxococcota bacterium]
MTGIGFHAPRGALSLTFALCALFGGLHPAQAQERADASRLRTAVTPNGLFMTDSSRTLLPGQLTASVTPHFARNAVAFRYPDFDNAFDPVVGQQLFADLAVGIGLFYGIDIGLVLPVVLRQRGPIDAGLGDLNGAGVGDMRLVPRIQLIEQADWGVDVAFVPELIFPTGSDRRFLGDPGLSFRPGVTVGHRIDRLQLLASLALRFRQNAQVEDVELTDLLSFTAGAGFDIFRESSLPVTLLAELTTTTKPSSPFSAGGFGGAELFGGARARVAEDFVVTAGGALGVSQAVGVPTYRVLLGFSFAPPPPDRDGDGIPDATDRCPTRPEDIDGYKDGDGCPDLDNDGDGLLDVEDECPDERETINGIADDDGCPDGEDGDRDADGIPDELDSCPDRAEDFDNHLDEDGCPDPDNDFDGVPDGQDECPNEHETINGIEDDDGCPDEGEGDTIVVEERIELKGTVLFESARSTIRAESKPLLNQVALQILANPQIRLVRIEGHTDDRGPSEDNFFLSQDRADSVRRYLVERGVEPERLVAEGYGEEQPIDTNETAAGRRINRRVEFVIVEQLR